MGTLRRNREDSCNSTKIFAAKEGSAKIKRGAQGTERPTLGVAALRPAA